MDDRASFVERLRACDGTLQAVAAGFAGVLLLLEADSGRAAFASHAYEAVWGRRLQDLLTDGGDWLNGVLDEDLPSLRAAFARCREDTDSTADFRIRHPDRGICWIHARFQPLRGEVAGTATISGIAQDVTEPRLIQRALEEHHRQVDAVVQALMDAVVCVDDQQRIVLANPAAERMFGYTAAELKGQRLDLLIPQRFQTAHVRQVERFGEDGRTTRHMGALGVVHGLRRDGEEIPLEVSITRHRDGERISYTAIARDISERQAAQQRIDRLNRMYRVLSGINQLIIRTRRKQDMYQQACAILVRQAGFKAAWIGEVDRAEGRIRPLCGAGEDEGFLPSIAHDFPLPASGTPDESPVVRAVRTGEVCIVGDLRGDDSFRHAADRFALGFVGKAALPLTLDGTAFGVLVLYAAESDAFDDETMRLLNELASDIAFAVGHLARIEHIDFVARYDVLTGLANLSLWSERLAQRLAMDAGSGRRTAVFVLDIENFRAVNEARGRNVGDELLRLVSQRFLPFDEPVSRFGRIGGDRFVVFVHGMTDAEHVRRYLDRRLDEVFHRPFQIAGGDVRVAVKIGVALCPDDGADPASLLRNAEAALKKAKATGQRYLFFAPVMTAHVAERLSMEARLRTAIDAGQFVLHYQPKFAGKRLAGCEALIRWNDPATGLMPPMAFIPVLEETGMIHEVGSWVMRQAVADYLRWVDEGRQATRIAVNVSPLQLRNRDFVREVAETLGGDARTREAIELEITESVIMEDVRGNIDLLQATRDSGVTVAIDDFGTGFSSLSYLSKLPADALKIDRGFIDDMARGPEGVALVSTIINLAHSMQMTVVAEGVETEEQRRILDGLGCDQMQGYLLGKPLPCAEFEAKFLPPADQNS
ncbi:MAG: EAL domain-containing protein [Proteobacteria bacterium]|nr:EAL domain-containing protein [Pseudomonadota bacterium]